MIASTSTVSPLASAHPETLDNDVEDPENLAPAVSTRSPIHCTALACPKLCCSAAFTRGKWRWRPLGEHGSDGDCRGGGQGWCSWGAIDVQFVGFYVGLGLYTTFMFMVLAVLVSGDSRAGPGTTAAKLATAGCAVLMVVWWVTEAVPLPVTALLPLVLLPFTGVAPAGLISSAYFSDPILLFFGSFLLAAAVEENNLHTRLALRVFVSSTDGPNALESPGRLLAGFLAASAFLSMWLNNTATAAMMLPLADAVVGKLEMESDLNSDHIIHTPSIVRAIHATNTTGVANRDTTEAASNSSATLGTEEGTSSSNSSSNSRKVNIKEARARALVKFRKACALGVAFSSSLGGMSTLTGTGPNIILKGVLQVAFPDGPDLSFGTWLVMVGPVAWSGVMALWGILYCTYLLDPNLSQSNASRRDSNEHDSSGSSSSSTSTNDTSSGSSNSNSRPEAHQFESSAFVPMTWAQKVIAWDFVGLVIAWLLRAPHFMPGWANLLPVASYPSDGTVAMAAALVLFLVPSKSPVATRTIEGGETAAEATAEASVRTPSSSTPSASSERNASTGIADEEESRTSPGDTNPQDDGAGSSRFSHETSTGSQLGHRIETSDKNTSQDNNITSNHSTSTSGDSARNNSHRCQRSDDDESRSKRGGTERNSGLRNRTNNDNGEREGEDGRVEKDDEDEKHNKGDGLGAGGQGVLKWTAVNALPWDVIFLLGGGYALSAGFNESGLSTWVANAAIPGGGGGGDDDNNENDDGSGAKPSVGTIIFASTLLSCALSNLVSNVATANIVLPLLTCVAARTGQHPWLVLVPATCGCSLAFLFPIGTPPNAIAYATGQLTMRDMATTGALLIVAVALLLAFACATIMPMVAQLSSEDTEWTQAACEQD